MEAKAIGKYLQISPQKIRKLVGAVKGQPAETAMNKLKFMPQKAARMVEKLVRSAIANADQKDNMDIDDLVVKNITVDQGPSLKRFHARARGRGTRILKKTSHITVILAEQ